MSFEITLPYRDRSDPFNLAEIADDIAQAIDDPTERKAMRGVATELLISYDVKTVGAALDLIETATPAARGRLLDAGRQRAGLPTREQVEARKAFDLANSAVSRGPTRDAEGRTQAICSERGCRAVQVDDRLGPGSIAWVQAKRWWCEEHRAGHEDDLQPYRSALAYNPRTGSIIDLGEQEAERQRQELEAESRRRQHEARAAERRSDADRLASFEQAKREQLRRESITGLA